MDIVVADDDPAVTWFLAGVLRAAGATVHEAHDGARRPSTRRTTARGRSTSRTRRPPSWS
ncbi:hypothetical protein BE08_18770 [Sorangium cellulosum]|uniref:Response regulatory domain-containing protein n=1 Tax=Sorangium cellulosum TaxID=56 RepID=A0A150PRT5_SORCE|nr:hypothetical protein BE08_18770 [Sorangium cellulosum]